MSQSTWNETQSPMEPQVVRNREVIVQCIGGLTQYAAELRQRAVPGEQARIPALRELVGEMAAYWSLWAFPDGRTPEAYQEKFDSRVAEAERTDAPLAATMEQIVATLFGLYIHAMDRIPHLGKDGIQKVTACKDLICTLKRDWNFNPAVLDAMPDNIETSLRKWFEREQTRDTGGGQ